jgi:hypothetical protein
MHTASHKLILVTAATCMLVGCQSGSRDGLFTPRGEAWTIECFEVQGPNRRADAESLANVLRQTRAIEARRVFVKHSKDHSRVYYGTYRVKRDPKEGTRKIDPKIWKDVALIKELVDDQGRRMFIGARRVPMPVADVGNPEWDLRNAEGLYTLQVGAYFADDNLTDFKQAAVDHVAQLRRNGYEAYFYHTDANSVVTVGTFGPEAFTNQDGQAAYSSKIRSLQKKERFAYNLTNGAIWYIIENGERVPVRSLIVRIPTSEDYFR